MRLMPVINVSDYGRSKVVWPKIIRLINKFSGNRSASAVSTLMNPSRFQTGISGLDFPMYLEENLGENLGENREEPKRIEKN